MSVSPVAAFVAVALASQEQAAAPYKVSFDGRANDRAGALVRKTFDAADAEWRAYTGLPLKFRQPMHVHVVTERSRVPGPKAKPACARAAHLFLFSDERGVPGSDLPPQGPGSAESLEREFVRQAMEALRKTPLPTWLEASAILAASPNPQSTFLQPSGFAQLYKEGHLGRGAALSAGPAKLENCIEWPVANPWTVLLMRFIRDTRGPEGVARVLRTAWRMDDVAALADNIPIGAAMVSVEKFNAQFDDWVRKKYGIAPPFDAGAQ